MNSFAVMILVCAAGMPRADCQVDTAVDVLTGPEASNEVMCALHGQAYFAESALVASLREGEYLKVLCTRPTIGTARAASQGTPNRQPAFEQTGGDQAMPGLSPDHAEMKKARQWELLSGWRHRHDETLAGGVD